MKVGQFNTPVVHSGLTSDLMGNLRCFIQIQWSLCKMVYTIQCTTLIGRISDSRHLLCKLVSAGNL